MSRKLCGTDEALALALLASSQDEPAALVQRLEMALDVWAQDLEHEPCADASLALVILADSRAKLRALVQRLEGVLPA